MSGKAKGGRRKRGEEEEHENSERWLVTYADMLTLLMVLFIVMFAISQVDQKKFAALKNGLATGFGAPAVPFSGPESTIADATGQGSPLDLAAGTGGDPLEAEDKAIQAAVAAADRAREQRRQADAKDEVENLEQVKERILKELTEQGYADTVRFAIDERGLIVTVITSSIVFAGDRAELLPAGQRIIAAIAPAIAPLPNRIEIDGHTNQLNVATINYPSGWELSTARASTVVRYLNRHAGIAENRMAAAGFADTRPLYDPADPRAVTLNRRVEIVVLTLLPASVSALLPSAVGIDSTTASGSGTESGGHE
ncbi:MAG: flagellar motor protein MotB [Dactylosporangium sp.]|nr:flagellar motor protein MotB [Dactylosporangium sp.]NNJ61287.1 flagellar motor protein MotB [Dactylosporangium sp.]